MTLREIGTGLSDWFTQSLQTVTTENLLDWPLLFAVPAICLLLTAGWIAARMLGSLLVLLINGSAASRAREERAQALLSGRPTDPRERLEWANRTGRYAPGADKGE